MLHCVCDCDRAANQPNHRGTCGTWEAGSPSAEVSGPCPLLEMRLALLFRAVVGPDTAASDSTSSSE